MLQRVSAWLIARPTNAVFGVALALMTPLDGVLGGAVLVLLVLQRGLVQAAIPAAMALGLLVVASMIVGRSQAPNMASAAIVVVPSLLLAGLLRRWQTLTLTLQVTALLAVAAILATYVVLGDPMAFWRQFWADMAEMLTAQGLGEMASVITENDDELARQSTVGVVFMRWSIFVAAMLFGYAMYNSIAEQKYRLGRFIDLNFGRVLAILMALASVGAWLSGASWLQDTGTMLLLVFWYQGLALVHWLYAAGQVPVAVVVATYVLLPIFHVVLIYALALAGYADAWLNFRSRIAKRNG